MAGAGIAIASLAQITVGKLERRVEELAEEIRRLKFK